MDAINSFSEDSLTVFHPRKEQKYASLSSVCRCVCMCVSMTVVELSHGDALIKIKQRCILTPFSFRLPDCTGFHGDRIKLTLF